MQKFDILHGTKQFKKIVGQNPKLLSELMYTVNDSVKMIVDMYNKFGSRHDESDATDSSAGGSWSASRIDDDSSDSDRSL